MNYLTRQILFREIPDEISLSYLVTGCTRRCPGCHSADSWNAKAGSILNEEKLSADIAKYQKNITCVLFLGGEWEKVELIRFLQFIKTKNLKTALYSGELSIEHEIIQHLDYLKLGPYIQELGGIESPNTNQKFFKIQQNELIHIKFNTEVQL